MLEGLQKKWKVKGLQLILIICTFAIGGSLTGYAGRKILMLTGLESGWLWIVAYILLITLLWPVAVLLISIPFGQFRFFVNYLKKIGKRMGIRNKEEKIRDTEIEKKVKIAIFASGMGSNAQKIIDFSKKSGIFEISLIVCNKPGAGVLAIAEREGIPALIIEKERFFRGNAFIPELQNFGVNMVVLAGFLWKIPENLIKMYRGHIINIHPALLPKYGGKGMYGHKVHEAVIAAGESESGITIHQVDEIYDHGQIIAQATCEVLPTDTPDTLAQRIHQLEHAHYPKTIEVLAKEMFNHQ